MKVTMAHLRERFEGAMWTRRALTRERQARLDAEATIARLSGELADTRRRLELTLDELGRRRAAIKDLALDRQAALVRLATLTPESGNLDDALCTLTRAATRTLDVERSSVWFLSPDRQLLICAEQYERSRDRHQHGQALAVRDYPHYFQALEVQRAIDAHDAATDPRTRELTEAYLRPFGITSMLDAAIRRDGVVTGVVCNEHVGAPRRWTADETEFCGALADQVALVLAALERRRIEQERETVTSELVRTQELAIRDGLTGLFNRRHLEQLLVDEVARSVRYDRPLAVAMLDIDHFKVINDGYGHPVADDILRALAELIRENLRVQDKPARYGGEELVLILPETTRGDAFAVAERVRGSIEEHRFVVPQDDGVVELQVTVSIGVASSPEDGTSAERLIKVADRAMYEAKALGRNRTVASRPSHHTGRFAATAFDEYGD